MTFTTRLATGAGSVLERRFSRRSLLGRTAVIGAAVTVGGLDFVLRPTPAYAAVCGPGAACAEGWTAMCCTINQGVNQCPAGTFPGGWWKADGASLCGGSARYYIDCQGECTHCGCRDSPFCTDNCWNCTRHCASGTCDTRRVCWNVFRYGQCNQQVGCSGPVVCRMISCVPPWQFEACTTDAATDENTTDHMAPCLSPWSGLQSDYRALGGPGSAVGPEVEPEYAVTGGTAQRAVKGRLYRAAAGGTHYVLESLLAVYVAHGEVDGLGLPTTSTARTPDTYAEFNDFAKGFSIYDSPAGTWVVGGAIRTLWVNLGRAASPLGYPAAREVDVAGGSWQTFRHGVIAASAAGAWRVVAPVLPGWTADVPAAAAYPTAAATTSGATTTQPLVGGVLCYSSATGAHAVYGALYTQWTAAGGVTGSYGLPTSGVTINGGGQSVQSFQNGTLTVTPTRSYPHRHPVPPPR